MLYPDNFENKIGFNYIRDLLLKNCLCTLGQQEVKNMGFLSDYEIIKRECVLTAEMVTVLTINSDFPSSGYYNALPDIKKLQIPGSYIEQDILLNFVLSLTTIKNCVSFFDGEKAKLYPLLSKLSSNITIPEDIILKAYEIINDTGSIRDNASIMLAEIRQKLKSLLVKAQQKLNQIINQAKKEAIIPIDAELTIRNGRMVLPVPAVHKRKIKGFIHDESATGQTVFIEPTEVFEINNKIRDLENDERKEIIKILTKFADYIRPYLSLLTQAYQFLGKIDFIRAKALLAIKISANLPHIVNKPFIKWIKAKHPLLVISNHEQSKEVVPADIILDDNSRILVISGPNAGGKSVCMKMVGLNQYMLQNGLLIPVSNDSICGIFKNIFIEIGDNQSLESDLSSYSSHLINISYFVKNSTEQTLFLIDEFGAGTEPQLGGAIAEVALLELNRKKAFGIVTTHYSNIKSLANSVNGIINGSMLFDVENLKPLYILKIGNPGNSFAFEVAAKTGFPERLIEEAKTKINKAQLDFEKQLNEIQLQKEQLLKKQQEIEVADQFLKEIIDKYSSLQNELQKKKEIILNEAKKEALKIINNANSLIEKTIREIKENQAEKRIVKKLRQDIQLQKRILNTNVDNNKYDDLTYTKSSNNYKIKTLSDSPQIGDIVKLENQNWVGKLVDVRGKIGIVASDFIKMMVPLNQIKKVDIKNSYFALKSNKNIIETISNKINDFQTQLDIRGMRANEAIKLLKHYIDDAIMLNVSEVYILHGKGDGILRQVVRDYLLGIPEIKSIRDQNLELGGAGITVVNFK